LAFTATSLEPDPGLAVAISDPYAIVVPYWNLHVVAAPLGLAVPARAAPVCVTPEATPVLDVGAGCALVLNVTSPVWAVPPPFVATSREW
jgi:hypothetical protein